MQAIQTQKDGAWSKPAAQRWQDTSKGWPTGCADEMGPRSQPTEQRVSSTKTGAGSRGDNRTQEGKCVVGRQRPGCGERVQRTGAPLTCLQGRWAWLIPTLQVGTPIKEGSGCWAFSKLGSGKNSNDNEDNGEDRHQF